MAGAPGARGVSAFRRAGLLAALTLICVAVPAAAQEGPDTDELLRIRVANRAGGAVEASLDGGSKWSPLGKVTRPATAVTVGSPLLSLYPAGTVAGVTPDHLLVRLAPGRTGNRSFRIAARGQAPAAASLGTDVPSGGGLFRCLAPPVGTALLLERSGVLEPPPASWVPRAGEVLVFRVPRPPVRPLVVTLQNRVGGEVLLTEASGQVRPIGRVRSPLQGIGRYAGTERAGSGALVSWSPTAVVFATAGRSRQLDDRGQVVEERGGFVIQPAEPALQGSTHPASQMLVEALPPAEGQPKPAASPFFALGATVSTGDPLDPSPTRLEVKVDGGNWEAVPDLRGAINAEGFKEALQLALGRGRTVQTGITDLRITFAAPQEENLNRRLRLASTPLSEPVQRGKVVITADVQGTGVNFVRFYLNDQPAFLTNQSPFQWHWDTTRTPNGEHLLEIRGLDENLNPVSSVTVKVLVDN